MTKLEKFLLTTASEMNQSDTTESRYFKINNIFVRLSDHISPDTTSDIQIITPVNKLNAGLYTVLLKDSYKILIWNLKQIKEFLPSLILMKEVTTRSVRKPSKAKTSIEKIELAQQEKDIVEHKLVFIKKIKSKVRPEKLAASERAVFLRNKSTWSIAEIRNLSLMMNKEFGRGDSINDDFQTFLNCNSLDYTDVLNLYKIIVIDNEEVPTIELLQEAYSYIK